MEIVDPCSAILSDREVLDILKAYNGGKQKHTNLATILYETTSYLDSGPSSTYTLPDLSEFLDELNERKYNLTKKEKIQIVNLKPQNETELHLIIDNIEDKLTDEQKADLLQLVANLSDKSSADTQASKKLKQ